MSWSPEAITALIEAHKCFPNLYDCKSESYHNRSTRSNSLDMIRQAVCHIRPGTTIDDIKVKLNAIRTGYCTAIYNQMFMPPGSSRHPWYFDKMSYLREHIKSRKTSFAIAAFREVEDAPVNQEELYQKEEVSLDLDESRVEFVEEEDSEEQQPEVMMEEKKKEGRRKRRRDSKSEITKFLKTATDTLKEMEDGSKECYLGKYITGSLMELSKKNRILCEKELMDVLHKYTLKEIAEG